MRVAKALETSLDDGLVHAELVPAPAVAEELADHALLAFGTRRQDFPQLFGRREVRAGYSGESAVSVQIEQHGLYFFLVVIVMRIVEFQFQLFAPSADGIEFFQTETDGIDELVTVFLPRYSEWSPDPADLGGSLGVSCEDAAGEWLIRLAGRESSATRGSADGNAVVHGRASDVLLFLYNRVPGSRVAVRGDESIVRRWTSHVRL